VIEQRRAKRFDLELPLEIVRAGAERVSEIGTTRNISSGGVLFMAARDMEIGGPVEYVVTLTSGNSGVVNLRCMGKVLRLHKNPSEDAPEPTVEVAISLERYEFMRSNGHNHADMA
jgi:PilZ domain-containing protein